MSDDSDCSDGGLPRRAEPILDAEEWQDYYSDDLVRAYHCMIDFFGARGVAVLDRASFHSFAHWAFEHSSGYPPLH